MGVGEIILLVIVGLIVLFILYMFANNLKMRNKQKKADKKAKIDSQPIADVSPVPIQEQENVGKVVPIRVNDPIFDKRGYENITERVELKTLIDEEHKKENKKIIEKLHNIEIVTEPVDMSNLEGLQNVEDTSSKDEDIIEEVVETASNVELKKEDSNSKETTVDIIKKMVEDEKNKK